jgi:hypothetical protein
MLRNLLAAVRSKHAMLYFRFILSGGGVLIMKKTEGAHAGGCRHIRTLQAGKMCSMKSHYKGLPPRAVVVVVWGQQRQSSRREMASKSEP